MKTILGSRRHHYVARVSIFFIMAALIAGMGACTSVVAVEYDLTISSTDGGSVTSPGEGTFTYDEGKVVDLVAKAEEGYRFVSWTGDADKIADVNDATTTIKMYGDYAIKANFEAEQVVVYDFVAEASSNWTLWYSGTGVPFERGPDWTLTFPGATNDNKGFACYRTNIVMEDDRTYDKVLETHPQWVNDGWILGGYGGLYDMGYKILTGDRFLAKVGLLKGAGAGNVTFKVWLIAEGAAVVAIAEITDTYDGTLRTIDVDLSPYLSGHKCYLVLGALTNGQANQDWAAWVEAKLIR